MPTECPCARSSGVWSDPVTATYQLPYPIYPSKNLPGRKMPVKFPSAYKMSMIKIKSRCEFFVSQRLFSLQKTRRFLLADTVNIMGKITSRLPEGNRNTTRFGH